MAETAVENGVVDADRADDCDTDFNAAKEAVQSLQENRDELDSEQAVDHSMLSHQPKGSTNSLTTSADCQEIDSGGLQEVSSQCEVSRGHSTAAGR